MKKYFSKFPQKLFIGFIIFIPFIIAGCGGGGGASPSDSTSGYGNISGSVTLEETTDYRGVVVKVSGTDLQATTSQNGSYKIENVPAGTQTITAEKQDYKKASLSGISVTANQETTGVNFSLKLNADVRISRGWQKYQDRDYDGSIAEFNAALEVADNNTQRSQAYVGLGWNYDYGKSDYSQAISNYDSALTKDSNNVDARFGKLSALTNRGSGSSDYETATGMGEQVITLSPNYEFPYENLDIGDVHSLLSRAYFYLEDYSEAKSHAEAALNIDPNDPIANDTKQKMIDLGVW